MTLGQLCLDGTDRIEESLAILRDNEPREGYYLAFSGGKDSMCVMELARMAGVKFDAHYNVTTVDPPELVHFIRKHYPDVEFDHSGTTMWRLIEKKRMPPTRMVRYCCEVLKEHGGEGRIVVTGVRRAESSKRSKRRAVEACYSGKKFYVNPIIDWSEDDVWEFIRSRGLTYCSLYDEGFRRLGCVMCPMQGRDGMLRDAERWPKIADAYKRALQRCYDGRVERGLKTTQEWESGADIWDWWLANAKKGSPFGRDSLF